MNHKFAKVGVESDTRIHQSYVRQFGKYEVLYQVWDWDGAVKGESLIFCKEDVTQLSEEDLENLVGVSDLCTRAESITVKESHGYVFVNFDFEMLE